MLKYHQEVFKLLNREPVIDQQAVEQLNTLEEKYHIKLPASVREWYSLKTINKPIDNIIDVPTLIEEFEANSKRAAYFGLNIENGFLTIMSEPSEFKNTTHWYVPLDTSDDPPVIVGGVHAFGEQHVVSPSFSQYIFASKWDQQLYAGYTLHSDEARDIAPLSEGTRQFLYSHFVPLTAHCDDIFSQMLRFERQDQRIRVKIDPGRLNWSYWRLRAASPDSLYALGKMLWQYDSLNTRSFAGSHLDSQGVEDRLKGQWEYQLSCSHEMKDQSFDRQDRDYLKALLTNKGAWGRNTDYSVIEEGYCFGDTTRQISVAILRQAGTINWRLRAENLSQLEELVKITLRWPVVLAGLMPDTYAGSYQETLHFIQGLRS